MNQAIQIGEGLGINRADSSCDYSYLRTVKEALVGKPDASFYDLAYIQKLIDELERERV